MDYDFTNLVNYFDKFSQTDAYKNSDFSDYNVGIDTFTVNTFSSPSLDLSLLSTQAGPGASSSPGLSPTLAGSGGSSSLGSSYVGSSIGVRAATIGSLYNSVSGDLFDSYRTSVDAPEASSPSIYDNSSLGLDRNAISKEVAGVLQAYLPNVSPDTDLNTASTQLSGDSTATGNLLSSSKGFIENVGSLDDATIDAMGRTLSARIFAKVSNKDGVQLDEASRAALAKNTDAIGTRVAKNLTVVRNLANSLVKDYSPDDGNPGLDGSPSLTFPNDRTAAVTIAKFSESYGGQGRRASKGLDAFVKLGFVPAGQAGGDGTEGQGPGFTQLAATHMRDAIVDSLHRDGIFVIDEERLDAMTDHLSVTTSSWVTAYAKVNDKLSSTPNGGITSGDLNEYMKLADQYDELPVTVGADGQLVVKNADLSLLKNAGKENQQRMAAKITADASSAGRAMDGFAGYEDKLNRDYHGDNLVLATEAMREGNALKVMSERQINVPEKNEKMSFRELQQGIADGTITDTSFLLDPTNSDAASFLDYLNRWNRFGAASPTIVAKLAGDTQRGFFFDTNTFTGEMSMNGSNWLLFLMAAGGLLSPLASKLLDAEIARKNTRKNQKYEDRVRQEEREYNDRVRAEDREFQERLLEMKLASEETQERIAADSRNKAVATGGSRTSVTISSPTQSK